MSSNAIRIPKSVAQQIMEIRAEELRLKRLARNQDAGKNIPNAVADIDVPFPWEEDLRRISPVNTIYSHLRAYWYRAGQRWVLYDVVPLEAMPDDMDTGSGFSGGEFKAWLKGVRPSEREDWKDLEHYPISDVQYTMGHRYKGLARPFWVLQGENGGHQYRFSPKQAETLARKGLPSEPPRIGELAPCPLDGRAIHQLQHLNRLHQMEDSIDRLRKSGSPEAAAAEHERLEREIRESEMAFIEAQMTPVVDAARSFSQKSEHADMLIQAPAGTASKFKDAYDVYKETGIYTL